MNERRRLHRAASSGGTSKGGLGSRVERCGASDGADGSESSSWPNSASGRRAIEGVDCGGGGGGGGGPAFFGRGAIAPVAPALRPRPTPQKFRAAPCADWRRRSDG